MRKWVLLMMIFCGSMSFQARAQTNFPNKKKVDAKNSMRSLSDWPKQLRNRGRVKMQFPENDSAPYLYETRRYQFISDQKHDQAKMLKLATTAESVAAVLDRIPLRLKTPPGKVMMNGAQGENDEKKHKIYLVRDEEAYLKLGGTKSTAGYYSGRNRAVYLRADLLILTEKPNYQLLIHELMHLNMHGVLHRCSAWFSEGNAEYVASAFYGTGSYKFTDMAKSIRERTRKLLPKEEVLSLPSLATIVYSDSNTWRKQLEDIAIENRYRGYMAAVLLVHYFYHLDDGGRTKVKNYLDALHKDAAENRRVRDHQQLLFTKAELPKIEKKIAHYWKTRGFKIKFVGGE